MFRFDKYIVVLHVNDQLVINWTVYVLQKLHTSNLGYLIRVELL